MKQLRVFGHTTVTVSVLIEVNETEILSEEEIYARARKVFGGVQSFVGNGGVDKLIGVTGHEETIAADEKVEFDDFQDEN